jgi:hypothetical protein
VGLDGTLHERVTAATASLINAVDIHDVNPSPPLVTKIDPDGVAHVKYGFSGPSRRLLVCHGTGRASLKVEFSVDRMVPMREPGN